MTVRDAGLWALRLWCVVGWVFFIPFVLTQLLYALLHSFGGAP